MDQGHADHPAPIYGSFPLEASNPIHWFATKLAGWNCLQKNMRWKSVWFHHPTRSGIKFTVFNIQGSQWKWLKPSCQVLESGEQVRLWLSIIVMHCLHSKSIAMICQCSTRIWGFPKIGVPQSSKSLDYFRKHMVTWGTPILGKPRISS